MKKENEKEEKPESPLGRVRWKREWKGPLGTLGRKRFLWAKKARLKLGSFNNMVVMRRGSIVLFITVFIDHRSVFNRVS